MANSTNVESEEEDNVSVSSGFSDDEDHANEVSRLQNDVSDVQKMVNFLTNYNPKKKRAGRPSKKPVDPVPTSDVNMDNELIKCIDKINHMNTKIVKLLCNIVNDQKSLRKRVEKLEEKKTGDSQSKTPPVIASAPLVQLGHKVDSLEQGALRNVLMCQGVCVDSLIGENSDESGRPKHEDLKLGLVNKFNTISPGSVNVSDISQVGVLGDERKHLKIMCATNDVKKKIITMIKGNRPDGIYVSDYLTKQRASIFYKMRCLKKESDRVQSVFTRDGIVVCRLVGVTKLTFISSEEDLLKFRDTIEGAPEPLDN